MRRPGIVIMGKLIGLIRPLVFFMVIAVMMGTAGYLCASFLTIAGAAGALMALGRPLSAIFPHTFRGIFLLLVCLGVLRGVLHYFEQECNHYIAFKLLAIIRHQVFAALRRLCPAKLEGKDRIVDAEQQDVDGERTTVTVTLKTGFVEGRSVRVLNNKV